jgi:hypothetical protein
LSKAAPPAAASNASTSIVLVALFSIINLGTLLLIWQNFPFSRTHRMTVET